MSCIAKNAKTYKSIDFTGICPLKRAGMVCPYCYVESKRKDGYRAKEEFEYAPYTGEILRLHKATVAKLNSLGGIRLYSFSDYMPEHFEDTLRMLDDCYSIGLDVRVITKQEAFVHIFGIHPAIRVINVSVDNAKGSFNPMTLELKALYPDKVRVRCVIGCDADLELFGDSCDVLTLNHNKYACKPLGWKLYSKRPKEVKAIVEKYGNKVCCQTGHCSTCKVRCGK